MLVTQQAPSPRARRRDANQGRILEAAMELVATGGLEALSMARLAEAADYTAGALYRYFPSKDALLATMVGQVLDEVQVFLLEAVPAGAQPRPIARIFALAHAYARFAKERPHAFGLLSTTLAEPRVLLADAAASPVHERAIAVLEQLASALGDATAAGQLRAPPGADGGELERTLVLFATLQGLLQLGKQARFVPSLADPTPLLDHALTTLLTGWGAKPKDLPSEKKS
ncbi:MAG: TetR/AcrR family transcriptional regulator [Myxococcaceae bacterium]